MNPAPYILGMILLLPPALSQAQELRVTLLGTGAPPPEIERFGPSTLVEAGAERLLFDVGRGTTQRLSQLNLSLDDVDAVFLSHLHADHTVGLPDLWLMSALGNGGALQVFGPEGTEDMLLNLREAYKADSRMTAAAGATSSHLVVQGVVYEQNGVTVTAFSVDHAAGSTPAFGYRIDYAGRSLVISGDTRPSENLVRFAQGVDLLIHEVIAARPAVLRGPERARQNLQRAYVTGRRRAGVRSREAPARSVYARQSVGWPGCEGCSADRASSSHPLDLCRSGRSRRGFDEGDHR